MITDQQVEEALVRIRASHAIVQRERTEIDSWTDFLHRNGIEFKFNIAGASWKRRTDPTTREP